VVDCRSRRPPCATGSALSHRAQCTIGLVVHPNHKFVLDFAVSRKPHGRYLDFGCGKGEVVAAGLARGCDIWGIDDFSLNARPSCDRIVAVSGTMQIPFPASYFDVIVSNQVFEHIEDHRRVLSEFRRILKPGGVMVHLFPSREVWREGHCEVPFAHRVQKARYLKVMYRLGFGVERERPDWTDYWLRYLATSTFYLPEGEIHRAWLESGFDVSHMESEYLRYRFGFSIPMIGPFVLKRFATMVLYASLPA
jgi:SAM-dependent methyltransferase